MKHTEEPGDGSAEEDLGTLRKTLKEVSEQKGALQAEVSSLQEALVRERERVSEMWRVNCMQLAEFDSALTAKDEELEKLREQLARLSPHAPSHSHSPSRVSTLHGSSGEEDLEPPVRPVRPRRGKPHPWMPLQVRARKCGWRTGSLLC